MKRLTFCLSLFLTTAIFIGCGGGADDSGKVPVFPASGTVTLNGSPLAGATVAFSPQSGQPTAIATTDDQGGFSLRTYDADDGAAEGAYKVVITKTEVAAGGGGAGESGDHEAAEEAGMTAGHEAGGGGEAKELVPSQYTSSDTTPLTAEVKSSGENKFTFELE